jgi:hypothetical protein
MLTVGLIGVRDRLRPVCRRDRLGGQGEQWFNTPWLFEQRNWARLDGS